MWVNGMLTVCQLPLLYSLLPVTEEDVEPVDAVHHESLREM